MLEIRYDQSRAVYLDPAEGIVASTATLSLFAADGSTVESPTVSKPTATGTVQAGSTALVLALDVGEAANFAVGEKIRIESDGVTYMPTVARINGDNLHLRAALSDVPDTGSTVAKIRLTATLSAPGLALLGSDFRLEWSYSDGTTSGYHTEGVSVVRWPWVSPVSADDVRDYISTSYAETRTDDFCEQIAKRASDKVAQALRASGRRAHLYPDPSVLEEPTWQAVHWLLAEQGYVPSGADVSTYTKDARYSFTDAVAEVVKSLLGYDANADGAISEDEKKGHLWSFKVSR
ncbi:MAG: hypothetical protein H6747_09610 [Deltaproteobacteria bacterium]|nr:hypothetical protein [Deltaproteobacteria bacterium]